MSYNDWNASIQPKAVGSWNLHVALPRGLDFFIMLSSVNGILGGRAQANYAAANTYQDALAHYRISLGEKAVSIDLGVMVGEGSVAEDTDLLGSVRRFGQLMDVRKDELLALMSHYCNPELPVLSHKQAQPVIGLETVAAIRSKGIDVHHAIHRPITRQLFRMDIESASKSDGAVVVDHAAELMAASEDEAALLVTRWYKTKIAQILGLQDVDIDAEKPVHTFGIDSLVAIDLKNWFARDIGAEVQIFNLLGNHPLGEVARQAAHSSRFRSQ